MLLCRGSSAPVCIDGYVNALPSAACGEVQFLVKVGANVEAKKGMRGGEHTFEVSLKRETLTRAQTDT